MVKRPMLFILISYIAGSCLYDISLFLCIVFCIVQGVLLIHWWNTKSKNRHDRIVVMVPFFFLLGYLLMNRQQQPGPLDQLLQEKAQMIECEGQIVQIQATKNSNRILLKEVIYGEEVSALLGTVGRVKSNYIILYTSEVSELQIGNRVNVSGELSIFIEPTNLGQFNEAFYYKIQNIDYKVMASTVTVIDKRTDWFSQGLYLLRQKFIQVFEEIASHETKGSLQAMLLGEKGMLDEETKSLYQVGGISHVLSISGLHITLLGMAIYEILLRMRGVKVAVFGTILFIILYGLFTNFSVSTNRAVVMMIIMLMARIFGKTYDLLSAVSLSALLILMKQPMQVYQSGFLLSYGAVIGVGVVNPCIQQAIRVESERTWIVKLIESMGFYISIQIATLPILLVSYYQIPTYAMILNLLILPFMSLVVILGLLGGILGCISIPLGGFVVSGAVFILEITRKACELVRQLPMAYIVIGKPNEWLILSYTLLLCIGLVFLYKEIRLGSVWIVVAVCLVLMPGRKTELVITMLDVGQGDGIFVENITGTTYLIDGGSSDVNEVGNYRILPFVKASGYRKIDYIMVSHGDSDHISGIIELLEAANERELIIGCLVMPYTSLVEGAYTELVELAGEYGVPVTYLERGDTIREGELKIECLHPYYDYKTQSENDASMVLGVTFGEFSMLFTGDMEGEAEQNLLQTESLDSYDILKVAHHGSKYSSSNEWLARLNPKLSLISVGKHNRYGHPHEETVNRLSDIGSVVKQTAENGAIKIRTDGMRIEVSTYQE